MKILIMGRAHTGKTTLANALAKNYGLRLLKTSTDRPRRFPEEDTYHFYTKEEAAKIPKDEKYFLTTALDEYERWTSKEDILAADVAVLDPIGADVVRMWQNQGHSVLLVYTELDPDVGFRDTVSDTESWYKLLDRLYHEENIFTRFQEEIREYRNNETDDVPLGADRLLIWQNTLCTMSLMYAQRQIMNLVGKYRHEPANRTETRKITVPIILEKESHTEQEWTCLCHIFSLPPENTVEIRIEAGTRYSGFICASPDTPREDKKTEPEKQSGFVFVPPIPFIAALAVPYYMSETDPDKNQAHIKPEDGNPGFRVQMDELRDIFTKLTSDRTARTKSAELVRYMQSLGYTTSTYEPNTNKEYPFVLNATDDKKNDIEQVHRHLTRVFEQYEACEKN